MFPAHPISVPLCPPHFCDPLICFKIAVTPFCCAVLRHSINMCRHAHAVVLWSQSQFRRVLRMLCLNHDWASSSDEALLFSTELKGVLGLYCQIFDWYPYSCCYLFASEANIYVNTEYWQICTRMWLELIGSGSEHLQSVQYNGFSHQLYSFNWRYHSLCKVKDQINIYLGPHALWLRTCTVYPKSYKHEHKCQYINLPPLKT